MKPSVHFKYLRFSTLKGILAVLLLGVPTMEAATIQKVIVSRQGIRGLASGIRVGSFGAPTINDTGSVAVYASIYGKGVDSTGNAIIALINRTKTARKIVQEGDDISSDSGITFFALGTTPVINNSRHISWVGEYEVIDGNFFIPALGNPNGSWTQYKGRNAALDGFPGLALNKRNATSLAAKMWDRSTSDYDLDAVFRLVLASSTALVAAGETPIGLPLGSVYNSFGNPTIDDKNNLYYVADVSDAGNAFDGIWFGRNGDPQPLVIKGQSAELGADETFSAFSDSPTPSPNGTLCGFAASAGGSNNGLWIVNTRSKVVTAVVTTATGVDGTTETLSNFQPPAINDKGQLAFLATSSATGKTGIYAWNGSKVVKVIAPGDSVNINGKDKSVIDIRFNPVHALNRRGVVVFTASFDDRTSGVFTSTL
jgi:hypothetical protein